MWFKPALRWASGAGTEGAGTDRSETLYIEVRQAGEPVDPALWFETARGVAMRKFILAAGVGILTGGLVTTQIAGPLLAQTRDDQASVYEQLDLFGDIFERIRAQYVEEVEEGELIEAAINGMLTSLDPHSSYLSPVTTPPIAHSEARRIWRLGDRSYARRGLCQNRRPYGRHPSG